MTTHVPRSYFATTMSECAVARLDFCGLSAGMLWVRACQDFKTNSDHGSYLLDSVLALNVTT